jgi:hypothetical protein
MINAVVRSTVISVMMYISFPRQLSLDNDYHGIQVILIHIFLLTHIKIHIILKNKLLIIIKAKYYVIEPHYMEGSTPDGPVANMPLFIVLISR